MWQISMILFLIWIEDVKKCLQIHTDPDPGKIYTDSHPNPTKKGLSTRKMFKM